MKETDGSAKVRALEEEARRREKDRKEQEQREQDRLEQERLAKERERERQLQEWIESEKSRHVSSSALSIKCFYGN